MTCENHPRSSVSGATVPVGVPLGKLAAMLGVSLKGGGEALLVTGVQQDSRKIEPGDLFVALRGATRDGARFAAGALECGAVAVLSERSHPSPVAGPRLEVDGVRVAMARAAAEVYGRATERMKVVGVTGTNGKTTSAHLIAAAIQGAGAEPAVIGTLGFRCADFELPTIHTSPEADELQRVAATMLARGASHLVMEVSSIALAAERVAEVDFDVAVFTNLTQDHLDYHHSMDAYATAKERLFFEHRPSVAVVNVDDSFGAGLASRLQQAGRVRVLRVSTHEESDVYVARQQLSAASMELDIVGVDGRSRHLRAPLSGAHNVSNLLCAAAVVEALGLDLDRALAALAHVPPVPGRLEACHGPADDIVALVDYAHTPDALVSVLSSLRPLPPGTKLWCVFGCGGDRDASKRALMGEAVARGADVTIVTNDNPRGEDPAAIARAVVEGVVQGGAESYRVVLDRAHAIEQAVRDAAPGDVVLVAGKGHEPYQVIGDTKSAFDDRVELRAALAQRRAQRGTNTEGEA